MTSGKEKYRKWALEYGASWAALAKENNGIFPYQVSDKDRTVGPWSEGKWYRGPYTQVRKTGRYSRTQEICNWDYTHSFSVTGWVMIGYTPILVMLDHGNTKHAEPVWTTVQALFKSRKDGLPSFRYSEKGWERQEFSPGNMVPALINSLYASTFEDIYLKKIEEYSRMAKGHDAASLAYLEFMYLKKGSLNTAGNQLRRTLEFAEKAKNAIKATHGKLPATDQDLEWMGKFQHETRGLHYIDGSLWSAPWSTNRFGNPSTASVRYFNNEGRSGLPHGVAGLVRHISKNQLILYLYNDNERSTQILLTAGHYGQHRFDRLNGTTINDRRVLVELPPKSQEKLEFTLTRGAYPATLKPYQAP